MAGVEERVKEFLKGYELRVTGSEPETCNLEPVNPLCFHCGAKLTDGNFALIDEAFVCLKCRPSHENKSGQASSESKAD